MGFEAFDVSGDAGLRVWGESLEDALESAASGLYALITDPSNVREVKTVEVSINKDTLEGLVVSWLNELIYFFDAHGFLGKRAVVKRLTKDALEADVHGEDFDPERHGGGLLIKAATYHGLRVLREEGFWRFEVILDI